MRLGRLALVAALLLAAGACTDAYPEGSPGRGGSGGSGSGPGGSGGSDPIDRPVPDVATSCRTACEAVVSCWGEEPGYDIQQCIQGCSSEFTGDDPCLKTTAAECAFCIAGASCDIEPCMNSCSPERCTGRCGGCEAENVCICDEPDNCWCEYDPCMFCGPDEMCECDYSGQGEYCACVADPCADCAADEVCDCWSGEDCVCAPDPCGGTCEEWEWCDCWSADECFCTSEDY